MTYRSGCLRISQRSMNFATALHIPSFHKTGAGNLNGKAKVFSRVRVVTVSLRTCRSSRTSSLSDSGEARLRT